MKKTIVISCFLLASIVSFGQQKKDTTSKVSDTLTVDVRKVKFIKVGNTVIPTSVMEKPGTYLTVDDLNAIFNQLQEYPAKVANPLTAWLKQFFGIR